MANVNIKFNNKDYLLSCDDGQEESLKRLTKFLDKKYTELKDKLGNIGENKLLLITTIQLIDEYFDLKQRVTNQKKKLDEISSFSGFELKKIEDSFASAANYLNNMGWKTNSPCFLKIDLKDNIPKKYLNVSAKKLQNKKI